MIKLELNGVTYEFESLADTVPFLKALADEVNASEAAMRLSEMELAAALRGAPGAAAWLLADFGRAN